MCSPLPEEETNEPARTYRFADGAPGSIGVITSVTRPFCGRCDRVRVIAEGKLRTCLFAREETDLRRALRGGASDEDIVAILRRAVCGKWAGHQIGRPGFVRPACSMSMIGG